MGPFVPDIITDELNLIVGAILGVAFGFLLEQAGFSSSRKLTGLFYGRDFTVLRVFFTAGITAMSGVLLLGLAGLLDTSIIFVHPLFLYPALVGGAVMGLGFVVGGFCPGTAFCGAAIGKIDAMVFVLGGLLGVFAFGEAYPLFKDFYSSGSMGDITAFEAFGLPPGPVALAIILVAVGAFVATGRIERKLNPSAPAQTFPKAPHRIAALGIVLVGVFLALTPPRPERLLNKASDPAFQSAHAPERMSSDELAFRILDKDPNLLLIDVREPEAVQTDGLPGALNIRVDDLFGKTWEDVLGNTWKKKVFFADDEQEAVIAAGVAELLGYENVAVLQGGLEEFALTVLNPQPPQGGPDGQLTRNQQDTYRFRLKAAPLLQTLIAERGREKKVQRRKRKVVGGCGI